jgi:hypothetical protein
MTPGRILHLAGKVGDLLTKDGVLDKDGNFTKQVTIGEILTVAEDAIKLLESEGVVFDPNVDKVAEALPALLALLGVK